MIKKGVTLLLSVFVLTVAWGENHYAPGKKNSLRAPSVPLVTSDPYFCIWSPYDKLYEGNTEHWTGKEQALIGALRVDGKTYRFMGREKQAFETILPMADLEKWEADYTESEPAGDWTAVNYDQNWKKGKAAFGTKEMQHLGTGWDTEDIWVRRTFELKENLSKAPVFLKYSHDDIFELYINGIQVVKTGYTWKNGVLLELSEAVKKTLKPGKNVIAAHCHNKENGGYVDFGLFRKQSADNNFSADAEQLSVDVLPTQTFYSFRCGPVILDVIFTSPLLADDLDLVSTPISYITYQVRPQDGKSHEVLVYFEASPQLAVHEDNQPVVYDRELKNGISYLRTGTVNQPILERKGDGVRIDWGYAYLAAPRTADREMSLGEYFQVKRHFIQNGHLPVSAAPDTLERNMLKEMNVLAYCDRMGKVGAEGKSGYVMLGYDDIYAIEYFYEPVLAYWKHQGKVDIYQAFERAVRDYERIMNRCGTFDVQLMEEAEKAGGKEYAELCALAYRQAIAAHKLLEDKRGNLLFLSKENHSNGCINTVDITYPSSPLFLIYNPDLLKGMMTSIFYYSESGRWTKPFPAHDLGTYPVANGQLYGGDMPVEEAGNMILLATAISKVEGNAYYAAKHWETLTVWADYLIHAGLDPENQLCTDDFAGHLAHNANLSVKAILAVAGYGQMAEMLGKQEVTEKYIGAAKDMAREWIKMADDGDHYRLTFDRPGTWSQKYNLVWNKVFDMGIFPDEVARKEVAFYLTKQQKYGLPLDGRKDYTKSDWIMWSACLADRPEDFRSLVSLIYKYAEETPSRVPLSDWHDTNEGHMMNFKARSVVGGYFMKLLEQKMDR